MSANTHNQVNMHKQTELSVDRRKSIIDRYLKKLIETDPNIYYASTSEIARNIHIMMSEHKNRMSIEDHALVKHLSVRDIETILSYH